MAILISPPGEVFFHADGVLQRLIRCGPGRELRRQGAGASETSRIFTLYSRRPRRRQRHQALTPGTTRLDSRRRLMMISVSDNSATTSSLIALEWKMNTLLDSLRLTRMRFAEK
jgi:hypothetical protein